MKIAHQLTENVKFLHKVALLHNGKVLVLKRAANAKSRPSAWDLPGGNAEWPETLTESKRNIHQDDIAREVIEETGFEVPASTFSLENLVHFFTYFDERKQVYSIVCGWVVSNLTDLDPDKVLLSDEHTEYRWIDQAELASLDFGEPVGTFVKTIIENSLNR